MKHVYLSESLFSINAQEWDKWIIWQFYFQFLKESPYCFPQWLYQFTEGVTSESSSHFSGQGGILHTDPWDQSWWVQGWRRWAGVTVLVAQAGLLSHKGLLAAGNQPGTIPFFLSLPLLRDLQTAVFPLLWNLAPEIHTTTSVRGNRSHSRLDVGKMVKQNWKKKKRQLKKRKYHNGFSREAVFGAMRTEYEENQTWTRLLALSTTLGNFLNFLEP